MRLFILMLLIAPAGLFAAGAPSTWPPAWASVTNGGAQGVAQDDHTNLDYGSDSWGYWANLDIEDGSGSALATIEMRYIEPVDFTMGASPGEEGARVSEMPQINVDKGDINGGQPFWVSALECTQQVWEEVYKAGDPNFKMRPPLYSIDEIAAEDTASFPINADLATMDVDPSGRPFDLSKLRDWFEEVGQDLDPYDLPIKDTEPFRVAFDQYKEFRAIESQTFTVCKDFCETKLEDKVRTQAGSMTINVRLPDEKEWEFLCRAGTESAFWSGPILGNVDFTMKNLTVNKSDFLFPFDSAIIDANISDALGGDGNLHKEWYSEGKANITIASVTLDGVATADMTVRKDLAGTVTMSGDLAVVDVVANFDERYQTHYVANDYGSHTPVLMTYIKQTSYYLPQPYAAIGANVYYRYLGTDKYVLASSIGAHNTETNRTYGGNDDKLEPADTVPGDYDAVGRLEYVEMVMVNVRCDSGGNEKADGKYTYDSRGGVQPIRTLYTPAPYNPNGKYIGSTFPDTDRGTQSNEEYARNADLSDNAAEEMTVTDYIAAYKKACADHLHFKKVNIDPWYTGNKDFTVTYTETEFDALGNPVEVNKSKTVTATEIVPSVHHAEFIENITVNATLNSAVTAVTPKEQMRNPFGLYNMHGNVAEWVDTTWNGLTGLGVPAVGTKQMTRGGSWRNGAQYCRSASRVGRDPSMAYDDVGFRFILTD